MCSRVTLNLQMSGGLLQLDFRERSNKALDIMSLTIATARLFAGTTLGPLHYSWDLNRCVELLLLLFLMLCLPYLNNNNLLERSVDSRTETCLSMQMREML